MSDALTRQVELLISALDKERARGFCDERGILKIWAADLVAKTEEKFDIGHKEAVARANTCERALKEIITDPTLSKQRILVIVRNALSRAKRLRGAIN